MRTSPRGRKLAGSQTLKIRIPKAVWNAYEPPTRRVTRSSAKSLSSQPSTATSTSDRQATTALTAPTRLNTRAGEIEEPSTERTRPTDCKVKLWAFHHGDPKRVTKGMAMHNIEYSTPCLQLSCKTCMQWHPHLMHEIESQSESLERKASYSSVIEPISPDIDPRILDGSWQLYQDRRGSASSAQSSTQLEMITIPQLTPVKHSFDSDDSSIEGGISPHSLLNSTALAPEWQVSLPASLAAQATATTGAQSRWRAAPREQYVFRLIFLSHEGKTKFVDDLRKRERKLKKQIYDRQRRAKMKAAGRGGRGAS